MTQRSTDEAGTAVIRRSLPDAVQRELAVQAKVCQKTIVKVFRGERVRGDAGRRAMVVLQECGLLPRAERGT